MEYSTVAELYSVFTDSTDVKLHQKEIDPINEKCTNELRDGWNDLA